MNLAIIVLPIANGMQHLRAGKRAELARALALQTEHAVVRREHQESSAASQEEYNISSTTSFFCARAFSAQATWPPAHLRPSKSNRLKRAGKHRVPRILPDRLLSVCVYWAAHGTNLCNRAFGVKREEDPQRWLHLRPSHFLGRSRSRGRSRGRGRGRGSDDERDEFGLDGLLEAHAQLPHNSTLILVLQPVAPKCSDIANPIENGVFCFVPLTPSLSSICRQLA